MNIFNHTIDLGNGQIIEIETGKLARQAHGSCVIKVGKTMLLATVVSNYDAREGVDFLPLSVDYQEKFAAVGRIPGSFHRREAKLSDYEVLICRLVDRCLRPMFPQDYHAETQVMIQLMSSDENLLPDSYVGLAASMAIMLSDIPFEGPISEARIARVNGQFIPNPTAEQLAIADLDILVGGTAKDINMVEGEMNEATEADFLEALKFGHEIVKKQCAAQLELLEKMGGRKPTREYNHEKNDADLRALVLAELTPKLAEVCRVPKPKAERGEAFAAIFEAFIARFAGDEDADTKKALAKKYFKVAQYNAMREMVLNTSVRLDGRSTTQVRQIWSEIDYLPAAHGSAVFTRGETQAMTSVTLGSKLDEQLLDSPMMHGHSRFMLHYNFPGFSTGEAKPNRGPGRREIGHGNLAARGLKKMLGEDVPYVIRIVTDVLESNGSSSMATVCSGSMALMDAGINLQKPVGGIAMGLISDEATGKYEILSDILGDEDHLGDMDFKVIGTTEGITACQMDIKINGLKWDMVAQALSQAREGRLHILNEMAKSITQPREELKPHTPRIEKIIIPKEYIGAVIGSGGKVIQELQARTNTKVSIEEVGNTGVVEIMSQDAEGMQAALDFVKGIITEPEVNQVYTGKISSVVEFGAFVEILPGKDGLLHISEVAWEKTETMEGLFTPGETIEVKLIEVDARSGKLRLSRKALLEKPEGYVEPERKPRDDSRGRDRDSRGGDRGGRGDSRDRNGSGQRRDNRR